MNIAYQKPCIPEGREKKDTLKDLQYIFLGLIILLGFALRLYQLDADSFWVDEANIVFLTQGSFSELIEGARSHAAAMPLDYVVIWLMAKIKISEGWLRFPSVIWSTLSLIVFYCIARQLIGKPIFQLLAVFLLAVSPFHIAYAQELRFYASAGFFYLLATWLQFRAIQLATRRSWFVAGIVTAIGAYFHVYVVLSFVNSFMWLLLNRVQFHEKKEVYRQHFLCAVATGLVFLPGFSYFGSNEKYAYGFQILQTAIAVIMGMEWIPLYIRQFDWSWLQNVICLIFSITAVITAFKKNNRILISIIVALWMQIGLIAFADFYSGYFVYPRQFLILLPLNYLLIAWFAGELWDSLLLPCVQKGQAQGKWLKHSPRVVIMAILVGFLCAVPLSLKHYYAQQKSLGREISQILIDEWKEDDEIWIAPSWDWITYWYYLDVENNRGDIFGIIERKELTEIRSIETESKVFLITYTGSFLSENFDQIKMLGFIPHEETPSEDGIDVLWVKD
jgi:hypothetical protein